VTTERRWYHQIVELIHRKRVRDFGCGVINGPDRAEPRDFRPGSVQDRAALPVFDVVP